MQRKRQAAATLEAAPVAFLFTHHFGGGLYSLQGITLKDWRRVVSVRRVIQKLLWVNTLRIMS